MFEDSMIESSGEAQTKKGSTVFLSVILHTILIVVTILIPLVYTERMEAGQLVGLLLAPPSPPPPAPPQIETFMAVVHHEVQIDPDAMIAPTEIPREIVRIVDADLAASAGVVGGLPVRGRVTEIFRTLFDETETAAPPAPAPAEPVAPVPQAPVRVGGTVIQANELFKPSPPYPALARQARIQGTVVLEATISKEGLIDNLRVITGHPLLTGAAIETVKTWRYKPTLLNGEPVDVITTITVNFALSR